ncbi:MAG: glycosyltransferase family 39 protein [Thermoflexales bacterium]
MKRSLLIWLVPVAAIGLFLSISLRQLELPGFYYDEGFDLTPMLALMRGEQPELLRGIGLGLGGMTLPLMRMDYLGSITGYLSLPFMAVFGPGVAAARLQPIFFSCVTLALAFVAGRRWFGDRVAALGVLMLAANPSFIWFSRQGITVTSTMTVFSLASLIALDVARLRMGAGRNARFALLAAGVFAGLGLWAKFVFLWWLVLLAVMAAVWLLAAGRGALRARLAAGLRALPWLAAGFVVGNAPLLLFNLLGVAGGAGAPTLNLLLGSLAVPTQNGVVNADFLGNLGKRLADFEVFLNGSYFWYNGAPFGNTLAMPWFLGSLVVGSALVIRRSEWRTWLAVLACIAVYLPISSFTVSGLWATHIFILLPLPQWVVACAAVWAAEAILALPPLSGWFKRAPAPLATLALAAICIALPFSRDLWVSEQQHASLARTGGSGRFSDAVYAMSAWLDGQRISEPIALDWGIRANIEVVTAGRVRPLEIHYFTGDAVEPFKQQARALLADPTRVYILLWSGDKTAPGFAVFDHRAQFEQLAREQGKTVREVFVASERSGLPVYVALMAK